MRSGDTSTPSSVGASQTVVAALPEASASQAPVQASASAKPAAVASPSPQPLDEVATHFQSVSPILQAAFTKIADKNYSLENLKDLRDSMEHLRRSLELNAAEKSTGELQTKLEEAIAKARSTGNTAEESALKEKLEDVISLRSFLSTLNALPDPLHAADVEFKDPIAILSPLARFINRADLSKMDKGMLNKLGAQLRSFRDELSLANNRAPSPGVENNLPRLNTAIQNLARFSATGTYKAVSRE